jgi:cytochrome c556
MKKSAYIAIAGALLLSGCDRGPPTPAKTVQQLMAEDVQPTAQVYWDAVRFESVLEDGKPVERDFVPETDADWKKTRDAATQLVELADLLKTPGYAEGRGDDWVEIATSLADAARIAEQAADARDPAKVFEAGGIVYAVCQGCHQVYPPAELAEDGAVPAE